MRTPGSGAFCQTKQTTAGFVPRSLANAADILAQPPASDNLEIMLAETILIDRSSARSILAGTAHINRVPYSGRNGVGWMLSNQLLSIHAAVARAMHAIVIHACAGTTYISSEAVRELNTGYENLALAAPVATRLCTRLVSLVLFPKK